MWKILLFRQVNDEIHHNFSISKHIQSTNTQDYQVLLRGQALGMAMGV